MKSRRLVQAMVSALTASLLVTACSSAPSESQKGSSASQAQFPAEVLIGAVYPLTGTAAVAGTDVKNGITLAMQIVNGQYPDINLPQAKWKGIPNLGNAKVKVIFEDHEGDPNKGKAAAERMITDKKVVALIGSVHSSVAGAIAPLAERYEIPYLVSDSTSPSLTEQGFKWVFRTTPHDGQFVENAFTFFDDLKKSGTLKGDEKIALATENGLFGQDTSKVAKAMATAKQYNIVEDIAYASKATNVDAEVQKMKAKGANIIMHASYGPDSILFLKAYKELDFTPKLIWGNDSGFVDSQFIKALGKDAEGIVSREVWANDLAGKKPVIAELNEKFKAEFGSELNGASARGLQGMLALVDAINRAKSTDTKAIQKALQATNLGPNDVIMPWNGIKFDEKGQNTLGNGIIVQVQNGKYVTVWPADVASVKLVYPFPSWKDRK